MTQSHLAPERPPEPAATILPGPRAALLGGLEWFLLSGAVGLWASFRSYNPLMHVGVLLLAASWSARWLRTGRLTRATLLDVPLALFMLSALLGLWAAPDPNAALPRFYLFIGALALYYGLANSHGTALRLAALGLAWLAAAIAVYFALGLGQNHLHRNDVAGLQAVAAPIALALLAEGANAWRAKPTETTAVIGGLAGLALLVIAPTPVLTQSRTVWLAWAGALGLMAWWWAAARIGQGQFSAWRRTTVFWRGLALAGAAVVGVLAWQPLWLTQALRLLPGQDPTAGLGRFVLFGQVWQLAQAAPFTGGGLGAFPALYSTYIHDIPHFLFAHAHSAYLNILVEQGWPGLITFAALLASAAWTAASGWARPAVGARALLAAGALGLAIVVLHGLGDATFSATWATPFFLVPAGLIVAALPATAVKRAPANNRRRLVVAAAALIVTVIGSLWASRSLAATWHANLGAVTTNGAQLAGWPTGEWDEGQRAEALTAADQHFHAALAVEPNNLTAHYYLGLQARRQRNFVSAAEHLEQAYWVDPSHRGLIKTLGFTYVWLGRYDAARPLLAAIPEARHELEAYRWWWAQQQRDDLAQNAGEMLSQLGPSPEEIAR